MNGNSKSNRGTDLRNKFNETVISIGKGSNNGLGGSPSMRTKNKLNRSIAAGTGIIAPVDK